MAVAILTQFTPNPNAMKFILNRDVKSTGKVTFRSADEANGIALVEALFALVVVEQVHAGLFENVVTVTKIDQAPWEDMADWVKQVLTNHVDKHDPDFELADAGGGGAGEPCARRPAARGAAHRRGARPYRAPLPAGRRRRPRCARLREQPRAGELRRRLRHL